MASPMEVRKRERSPVLKDLIETFEKQIDEKARENAEQASLFQQVRLELRNLKKRLLRYEAEPPMFPVPMLQQIKILKHFGLSQKQLADLYETTPDRIDRVLGDREAALIQAPMQAQPRQATRRVINV